MKKSEKIFITLLLAIIIIGGFARFYKLGEVSFVADEFLDINASYGYAQTGNWKAWDFNLGEPAERVNDPSDQRAWLYRIQVASLFKKFPPTETVARSVSASWGIITMLLVYWVGFYFTRRKTIGLLSAFLFAVSISAIIFDRRLRMYAMFFPVFLAFSWTLFAFYEEKYRGKIDLFRKASERWGLNLVYLIPMILLGLLSFHLHDLAASIAAVFLAYAAIQLAITIKRGESYRNKYSAVLAGALLVLVLGIILSPEKVEWYKGTIKFFNDNFSYFSKVLVDYSHPLLAIFFLIFGIYHLCKIEKKQKEAAWLSVSFFVILLMAAFLWRRNAGPQYIFFAQSFEMILIATGIFGVAKFFENNLSKYGKRAFYASIAISLLILPNYAYFFEENNVYRQNSRAESPNYRKVFAYFKKHRTKDDVLITRDFRNYYWSGEKATTYDFGGELSKKKFSLEELEEIMSKHQNGWIIYSDNDENYISPETEDFVEDNMEKVDNIQVRGNISVYRWGSIDE